MPYGRYRRRRTYSRRPRTKTTVISHVPSTIDQQTATNIASVIFACTPAQNASGTITSGRLDSDRDRDVSNGSKIGTITFTFQGEPDVSAKGTLEYCVFRTERSQSTPALGTILPTSAEIASVGLQQMMRLNLPGWVMKFGAVPVSAEMPFVRNISCNVGKFMKPIRDGDFVGIIIFNRTVGTINWSMQMRYKEYR